MIRTEDGSTGFSRHFAVPTASAARVQNPFAGQFAQFETGLRFERRAVFVVVSNFVAIPLKPEAGKVFLLDEPGNSIDDGMTRRTFFTRNGLSRHRQRR